ncbi:unnamed protein product [Oikopleura dioica]|uniref:PDZ domain-containing protein n=1 Tax=Oikopleura dioica TaxID=34765 RepID=E4XI95_OIKDI|nr:unnamed protein product [Oikopleura dioica]CBY39915.1 unnamed protein product [Oikopleura dioica]
MSARRMLTTYSYTLRGSQNFGLHIQKDENRLPKVKSTDFASPSWMVLKTNDEIMRINDHPVWNLSKDEIDSLLLKSEGKVHVVLRR